MLPIIVLVEGRRGGCPADLVAPRPGVLPFLSQRTVHPLELAVLLGTERPVRTCRAFPDSIGVLNSPLRWPDPSPVTMQSMSATAGLGSMRETSVSRPLGVSLALGRWGMGGLLFRKRGQLAVCGNPSIRHHHGANSVFAFNGRVLILDLFRPSAASVSGGFSVCWILSSRCCSIWVRSNSAGVSLRRYRAPCGGCLIRNPLTSIHLMTRMTRSD